LAAALIASIIIRCISSTPTGDFRDAELAGLRTQDQHIKEQIAQVESMLGGESVQPQTP
jgi:hypothetical protein